MKSTAAILLLFLASVQLSAQSRNSSADADTTATYLTPMEYAFMMHEETKFMLRMPFVGLGVEVELLPYFTYMAQASIGADDYFGGRLAIESELRWYYSSKKKGMRNMSGNYIAAGVRMFDQGLFYGPIDGQAVGSNTLSYVRWGMQRRMLGNGLIDMGILAGYQPFRAIEGGAAMPAFRVSTTASLGLGMVFGKRKDIDWQRLCPVTKCYDVERFMLKVNFANTLNYWYFPNQGRHALWLNPKFAVEYKVLDSPFSVNANVAYNLGLANAEDGGGPVQVNWQFLDLRLEGRWYYNLKRRMLQGKGGNGLSGNYIAVGAMQERFGYASLDGAGSIDPYISTGIQRTLGKRFYIDVNVGFVGQGIGSSGGLYIQPFGDMQLGFRF